MNKLPLAVVSVSVLAVSQMASAGVKLQVNENAKESAQVSSILKALNEASNSKAALSVSKTSILKAFDMESHVSDVDIHIEAVNTAAGCCHNNCHVNCHSNCHSSRSWR